MLESNTNSLDFDSETHFETSVEESYILFKLSGHQFAISLVEAKRVLPVTNITPVPFTEDFIAGIFNFRNHLVTVFQLDILLKLNKSEAAKNKLLILKNGSNLFGILVEEVSSIQKIQANKIYAVDSNFQLTAKEFLKGIYKKEENSESIFILSISGILESEQFQKYEER
ncbi:MAG: chemotaxis protein CheW [Leptospiraceae bacterium]|nr:chemotaxis protein CheW [Leptospiraceae bacterium]